MPIGGLVLALAFPAAARAAQEVTTSPDLLTTLESLYQKAADKASKSVVAIKVEREPEPAAKPKPPGPARLFGGPRGGELEDLFSKRPADAWCTGTILEADGIIATTHFNVSGTVKSVTVRLLDGREFEGKVVASNATDDIALIRIEAKNLPTLPTARLEDLRAGDSVMALGRSPDGQGITLNPGIVSAVSRLAGHGLQTDAKLNFGNVGGPLVDLKGRMLAITCKVDTKPGISSTRGQNSGVGFAITMDQLSRIVPDLKAGKNVAEPRRPFLGIEANIKSTITTGVELASVQAGGAAEKAGIKSGDVIVEMDGKKIASFDELRAAILRHAPGEHIRVKVQRGGMDMDFECELGWAPGE
jgi:S1-C subfamily serine protease